jgi:dTDP-glucose 4,6-dehydratase
LRVAVLGSNSFAGGDFVDLLLESGRFDVLGISRSPERAPAFRPYAHRSRDRFAYRQLDLNRDAAEIGSALDGFRPEYVVNYAAQGDDAASWSHPEDFFRTNCVALARLIDHLSGSSHLRRFLQISSSSVYGAPSSTVTETSAIAPHSPYAVSKAAADLLLTAYHRNSGFPVQILRPPNLYGPCQQLFRIVPKSIVLLKRGLPIELHGGGEAVRSYLHVRDASRAALAILEQGATGEAYNVSADELSRVRDVVAIVCELLGKDFEANTVTVGDRRGQSSVTAFDSTKIRRELGWQPRISLREGIGGVRDWIEREWRNLTAEDLAYVHQR